jgi:spore coat protein U-like protein
LGNFGTDFGVGGGGGGGGGGGIFGCGLGCFLARCALFSVGVLAGAGTLPLCRACCGTFGPTSVTSTAVEAGAVNFSSGNAKTSSKMTPRCANAEAIAVRLSRGSIGQPCATRRVTASSAILRIKA